MRHALYGVVPNGLAIRQQRYRSNAVSIQLLSNVKLA